MDCQPCEEAYDSSLDNRRRKCSPLATTAFAFVEASDEPCHVTILLTSCIRLMRLCKVGNEQPVPTEWHRHSLDSLYLFLADAKVYTQTDAQAAPVLAHAQAELCGKKRDGLARGLVERQGRVPGVIPRHGGLVPGRHA